jgi:hypothetical protein
MWIKVLVANLSYIERCHGLPESCGSRLACIGSFGYLVVEILGQWFDSTLDSAL